MLYPDLIRLGVAYDARHGFDVFSPIDGSKLGSVTAFQIPGHLSNVVGAAKDSFDEWRKVPAPIRGEFINMLGLELRANKEQLAKVVTAECGKSYQESLGEVQEMIDVCDFAVGLSRQLYGLTMGSERPGHKLLETWHPLGPVLVISAFNFPVAVWAWNYAIATICGNSVIWKPSNKTPFSALVCEKLVQKVAGQFNELHPDTPYPMLAHQVAITETDALAQTLVEDSRIKLVSATGSTAMGKKLAPIVAARLGKSLFELGGNNAMTVMPSADLDMALRAIVFSAVGTAGQRCTTLRRLFVHADIYHKLVPAIKAAYKTITIGDPRNEENLVGPLIDLQAHKNMRDALVATQVDDGKMTGGRRVLKTEFPNAYYIEPAIIEFANQNDLMMEETFAPILYIVKIDSLDEGIELNNSVTQGLSSSIFSTDIRETELFLTEADTGITNVNIGTSGAEIGGAFGGEKDTGGGRESGSDSWKAYMRRATNTINYSNELPLAQGINFDI